jgi:uroporphyrinogen decarboxylase
MISQRDAFFACMDYRAAPQRPFHLVGWWPDTLARWKREGLPADVRDVHAYLGLKPLRVVNVTGIAGVFPSFPEKTLEETETVRIFTDGYGRTVRDFKDHTSMPEWLDFAVKTPADLRRVLDGHFNVSDLNARYDAAWEKRMAAAATDPDALILLDGGGYYWTLRSLAGVENASYLLYDAPELVDELCERYFTVVMEGLRRIPERIKVDIIGFGEDIAYKTGTLMSKEMFRNFILPRYRKTMILARDLGIRHTWYDSDGDLRPFIPDYLEAGITTFAPCEVAAGMDPVALRKEYGRELRLIGGFDKRIAALGPKAIDAEFARLRPLIAEGGFIPSIDHSVSADISWDNYRHYLDAAQRAVTLK